MLLYGEAGNGWLEWSMKVISGNDPLAIVKNEQGFPTFHTFKESMASVAKETSTHSHDWPLDVRDIRNRLEEKLSIVSDSFLINFKWLHYSP